MLCPGKMMRLVLLFRTQTKPGFLDYRVCLHMNLYNSTWERRPNPEDPGVNNEECRFLYILGNKAIFK